MRRLPVVLVAFLGVAAVACKDRAAPTPPADEAFGRDVERICQAEELSGAAAEEPGARPMLVAQWLGENIETQRGRDLLAEAARADGVAKAEVFERAARSVGRDRCATAESWRK